MRQYLYSFFVTLLSVSILISCKTNKKLNLKQTADTILLSPNIRSYMLFSAYADKRSNLFYSIYSEEDSTIYLYNFATKKETAIKVYFNKKININNALKSYIIYNIDSIFLQHHYQITIIDTSGKVKYERIINNPFATNWPDTIRNSLGSLFDMYYNAANQLLYLHQYSGKYYAWSKPYYDMPVEAGFNLTNGTFGNVPIYFPEKYTKNYFGELNKVFRTVNNNLHVFSFMADANVYVCDITNNTVKKILCRSKYDTALTIKPISAIYKDDIDKKMDHYTTSSVYLKILYDPYRNLYYRFFSAAVPLKNKDGTYNTNADKPLCLMVLDKDFNILNEYLIDENEWYWSFVAPDGLYLKRLDTKKEDKNLINEQKIVFDIFNFSVQ